MNQYDIMPLVLGLAAIVLIALAVILVDTNRPDMYCLRIIKQEERTTCFQGNLMLP